MGMCAREGMRGKMETARADPWRHRAVSRSRDAGGQVGSVAL